MTKNNIIVFFDVTASNINRIILPIVNILSKRKHNKIIILTEKIINQKQIKQDKFLEAPQFLNFNDILRKPTKKHNLFFVTFGYRIPDLYFTYQFKKRGFKTIQVQHGMYKDFLKRSITGYFLDLNRKFYYLKKTIFFLKKFNPVIFLYLINKDFIKSYTINTLIKKNQSKLEKIKSDAVFIWGESWRQWFIDNHFYTNESNFEVIGNPDFHKFIYQKKVISVNVCYIAQTFCEDGRMSKNDYVRIIQDLSKKFKKDLYVKLHPRSNVSLYSAVEENGGKLGYQYPTASMYIGHYSSLFALALNSESKVVLIKVNTEEIPDYFKSNADYYFESYTNFLEQEHFKRKKTKRSIDKFFKNTTTPTNEIISTLIQNAIR